MCQDIRLSIVLVSWNAKDYLLQCIESIRRTYPDVRRTEIIVVDNNSADGSADAVEASCPDVELVRNAENQGFAKANNTGIDRARGEYVALINSDVIVGRGCLQQLCRFLDDNPSVGLAGPRILNPDETLQPSCREFPNLTSSLLRALALDSLFPHSRFFGRHFMTCWSHDCPRDVDVLSGCFWVARRAAIDSVGGLDSNFFMYGEDIDWCRRFQQRGWRVVYVPSVSSVHFGGASSANAPVRFYIEMHRANLQYWKKHHGLAAGALYLCTLWLHHNLRLAGFAVRYLVQPSQRRTAGPKLRRSLACMNWLRAQQWKVLSESRAGQSHGGCIS